MLDRDRTFLPRMHHCNISRINNQAQPLSFPILKIQRHPPVPLGDLFAPQDPTPPAAPPNIPTSPHSPPATPCARCWRVPRRSRDVGQSKNVKSVPGDPPAVRIVKMIRRDVVLVDRLLHQPQAKGLCIKSMIRRSIRRDGSQVMKSVEVHDEF